MVVYSVTVYIDMNQLPLLLCAEPGFLVLSNMCSMPLGG